MNMSGFYTPEELTKMGKELLSDYNKLDSHLGLLCSKVMNKSIAIHSPEFNRLKTEIGETSKKIEEIKESLFMIRDILKSQISIAESLGII